MRRAPDDERRCVCKNCNATFYLKPSKVGAAKFCSKACMVFAKGVHPRPCVACGTQFTPRKNVVRFCSKKCEWAALKGPEFNAKMSRESAAHRGNMLRDRGAGISYRKRGGRHEHRAVAEEMLGRQLGFSDVVHHIDGDKRNNDPSNLQVLTRAEHMREHGLGIPGKKLAHEPWKQRGKR